MKTVLFREYLEKCEDAEDFKKLMEQNSDSLVNWSYFFEQEMNTNNITNKRLADYCHVTQQTSRKWKKSVPTKREHVIGIGMCLGYNQEQINTLLSRYAKYSKLYPKNPEDAIYIYLINNHLDFKLYRKYADKYCFMMSESEENDESRYTETTAMNKDIIKVQTDEDFDDFMQTYSTEFNGRYHKLLEFLETYLHDTKKSINGVIANERLKNKYNNEISNLRRKKIIPKRNLLIALGIHMEMNVDYLNKMLELAGMEALCPKDSLESGIIFILEDLYLNDPVLFSTGEFVLSVNQDELIQKVGGKTAWDEENGCFIQISDAFLSDQHEKMEGQYKGEKLEFLADYVKRRIEEMSLHCAEDNTDSFAELL